MSEATVIENSLQPYTKDILVNDLRNLGLQEGDIILVHSSLSKIGWVVGKEITVIESLKEVLTKEGTLVMPTFSGGNSEPSYWKNPPVPNSWYTTIREHTPAFNPHVTPTMFMGKIADTFFRYPEVIRSMHPQTSFSAWGKEAKHITENHTVTDYGFGKTSPLYKLLITNAKVLLLGVGYGNCTSLHLCEVDLCTPKMIQKNGASININNKPTWVTFDEILYDDSDFDIIGKDYERNHKVLIGNIGQAKSRLLNLQDIYQFGLVWMKNNRKM
jgi:aminoglycoside 3-N-acetyltransferase